MNNSAPLQSAAPKAMAQGVRLPGDDVRRWIDESAKRGWTESSRRFIRVALLIASDILSGVIGVQLVLLTWPIVSAGGERPKPDEIPLLAMVLFLQPLALQATRAYQGGRGRVDLSRITIAIAVAAALGWAQARLFGYDSAALPNKTAYLYAAALTVPLTYLGRLLLDRLIRTGFRSGRLQRRVLVVGSQAEVERIQATCDAAEAADIRIVGHLDPGLTEIGATTLEEAVQSARCSGVLIVSTIPHEELNGLIGQCFKLGLSVSLLPKVLNQMTASTFELRASAVGTVLNLAPIRLDLPQFAIKRSMDVALTVLGLLLIWPLWLLIAIAIKLDSRGPVLFSQVRAGLGGRPFRMLKFRTMRVGADAEKASLQHLNEYPDARLFKIKDDPRVTRLGRFLRRSSLDELPQLLNVVRGQMSLVGPRPCVPEELTLYSDHHRARLFVVPGITGPWQVSGRNEILDFDLIVRMETEYIQSWSIASDLMILAKTVPAVFRRGAY